MVFPGSNLEGLWTERPSAYLLRELDDDPLRAADVAEPIDVLVALHFAYELRAAVAPPERVLVQGV